MSKDWERAIRLLLSPPFSERVLALLLPCISLCVSLLKQGDSKLYSSSCLSLPVCCVCVCWCSSLYLFSWVCAHECSGGQRAAACLWPSMQPGATGGTRTARYSTGLREWSVSAAIAVPEATFGSRRLMSECPEPPSSLCFACLTLAAALLYACVGVCVW